MKDNTHETYGKAVKGSEEMLLNPLTDVTVQCTVKNAETYWLKTNQHFSVPSSRVKKKTKITQTDIHI